jgi:chromosome segregation ATPase
VSETTDAGSTSGASGQWYLKIDDGSVFGPVDTAALKQWARQGRIAPGNEISRDSKTWLAPESVPELEMCWKVELRNGTFYGPLNLRTLADLVEDGTVSEDARLVNVSSGEESTVAGKRDAIFSPHGRVEVSESDGGEAAARAQDKSEGKASDRVRIRHGVRGGQRDAIAELQAREQIDQLRKRLARTEATLEQTQRELDYEKTRHAYARDELAQRKAELASRVELSKKDTESLMAKLRRAEEELEKRTQGFRRQAQEGNNREAEFEQSVQSLNDRLAESYAEIDTLQAEVEAEKKSRAGALELASTAQNELKSRIDVLSAELKDARSLAATTEEARAQTAKHLEQAKADAAAKQDALAVVRKALDDEKARVGEARARISALERDVAARNEGIARAAETEKRLMEDARRLSQQHESLVAKHTELAAQREKQVGELSGRISELEALLRTARAESEAAAARLEDEKALSEALQKSLHEVETRERKKGETFKQVLLERANRMEKQLEVERGFFEVLREESLKKQELIEGHILEIHQMIGGELEEQREEFNRQKEAVAKLAEVEKTLIEERTSREQALKQVEKERSELEASVRRLNAQADAQTEQLRQLEEHRKALREVRSEAREKERLLQQKDKSYSEEVGRLKQKEAALNRQIEEVRRGAKATAVKLEQTQKELVRNRKQAVSGVSSAGDSESGESQTSVSPEDGNPGSAE